MTTIIAGNYEVTGTAQVNGSATFDKNLTTSFGLNANGGIDTNALTLDGLPFTYTSTTFSPTAVAVPGSGYTAPVVTYTRQNGQIIVLGNVAMVTFDLDFGYAGGPSNEGPILIGGFPEFICGGITNTSAVSRLGSNSNGEQPIDVFNNTELFAEILPNGGVIDLFVPDPIFPANVNWTSDGQHAVIMSFPIAVEDIPPIGTVTQTITYLQQANCIYFQSGGASNVVVQGSLVYTLS